jgi:hypothetical protein
MKALKLMVLLATFASAAACGGDTSPATTTPSVTVGPSTELFEGTVVPQGSAFYSFQVQQTGNVNLMLASVTSSAAPGTSSAVTLGISIGVPSGTDCTIQNAAPASAGLTSQLVVNMTPGLYCARVYDIGNLKATVNFAVRIIHT